MIKTIITIFGIYTASSNRLLLQNQGFVPIQPAVVPPAAVNPPPVPPPGAFIPPPQFVPIEPVAIPPVTPPQPPPNVAIPAVPAPPEPVIPAAVPPEPVVPAVVPPEPAVPAIPSAPVTTVAPPVPTAGAPNPYTPQAPPPGQYVPQVPPSVPAPPVAQPPAPGTPYTGAFPPNYQPAPGTPYNPYAVPSNQVPNPYAPPPMAPRKIECKLAPPDPNACANKMTTIKNPDINFDVTCSGLQGCMNSRVTVNYDQFASPMIETFKGIACKNDYSCLGAVFQFVNMRQGDKIIIDQIKCDKPGSCMNTQFILGAMMELEPGDMFCGPQACQGCVVKERPGDVGKPCWEYTEYI